MGWRVAFSGRSRESVDAALRALPPGLASRVAGLPCGADDPEGLGRLWKAASAGGRVDAVILNAGVSYPNRDFTALSEGQIRGAIETNLIGPMMAAKVMIPLLREQGGGFFYAMEGLGSRGEYQPSLALYGTGKYGLSFFMRAMARENRRGGVSIGLLSPGMVVTDLLLADSGGMAGAASLDARRKRLYGILADRVETVAPFLASRVAKDVERGPRPGRIRRFAWLTGAKAASRFLLSAFVKRDVFPEGAST
jgi:NAD(P)-dependent dehydrogenase (short-subunit alcohol dehydrogenase family)